MKIPVIAISFLLPVATICQIPNPGFEAWTIINNVEEPDGWDTNNEYPLALSVSKTTDSYEGDFALQVIGDGPSFEGPGPGFASAVFTTNGVANKISAYVKCDSISGTGKGIIRVFGYSNQVMQEIGYWETNVVIPQYALVEIPLTPAEIFDSIQVILVSNSIMDGTGWPTGFARLKVDDLKGEIISGTNDLAPGKLLEIFPNPCRDELNLKYTGGALSELQIFDINGRVVFQQRLFTSSAKINVEHFDRGVYFIRTIDQNGLIEMNQVFFN